MQFAMLLTLLPLLQPLSDALANEVRKAAKAKQKSYYFH